jgi:hypothetical protein
MRLLKSVVVSAMVSETQVFTCHKFPDWTRWFWLMWALLPAIVVSVLNPFVSLASLAHSIRADFTTGLAVIVGLFLPVGLAAG